MSPVNSFVSSNNLVSLDAAFLGAAPPPNKNDIQCDQMWAKILPFGYSFPVWQNEFQVYLLFGEILGDFWQLLCYGRLLT